MLFSDHLINWSSVNSSFRLFSLKLILLRFWGMWRERSPHHRCSLETLQVRVISFAGHSALAYPLLVRARTPCLRQFLRRSVARNDFGQLHDTFSRFSDQRGRSKKQNKMIVILLFPSYKRMCAAARDPRRERRLLFCSVLFCLAEAELLCRAPLFGTSRSGVSLVPLVTDETPINMLFR